ncbi:hypothetical protein A1OU_23750 [Enterovibrio norvegicus]|nr:hypothetical protein A1OU_23750 [Enterovibrio norvegicus]
MIKQKWKQDLFNEWITPKKYLSMNIFLNWKLLKNWVTHFWEKPINVLHQTPLSVAITPL